MTNAFQSAGLTIEPLSGIALTTSQLLQAAVAFALALAASLLLMPFAIAVGQRFGLVTEPRLFGRVPIKIPFIGGIALAAATSGAFAVATRSLNSLGALIACSVLLLVLGLADDHLGKFQSPIFRLFLQFGVAIAGWTAGLRADTKGFLGAAGSILFLVAAMNALNLLDNMDGVAGMTAAGTAAGITGIAIVGGQFLVAALAAAVCGSCLGFLKYNFKHARIYLGNGGSLFLGFMLGAAALKLRPPIGEGWGLPTLVVLLAVPIADTSVAILSRVLHRRPVMSGGTDHISHRLVRLGLNKQQSAAAHGVGAIAGAAMVAIALFSSLPQLLLGTIVFFALGGLWLLRVKAYEGDPRVAEASIQQ